MLFSYLLEFKDDDSASSSDMSEYGSDGEDYDELGSAAKLSGRHPGLTNGKPRVEDYMDLMDRELAKTNVGKSFERKAKVLIRSGLSSERKPNVCNMLIII